MTFCPDPGEGTNMSSEMFLQGTDPSSFGRITFSISHPVALSPQSGGNTTKHPWKQRGGNFSGAPGKAGRAGLVFTPLFPPERQNPFFFPPEMLLFLLGCQRLCRPHSPSRWMPADGPKAQGCGNQSRQKVCSGFHPPLTFFLCVCVHQ